MTWPFDIRRAQGHEYDKTFERRSPEGDKLRRASRGVNVLPLCPGYRSYSHVKSRGTKAAKRHLQSIMFSTTICHPNTMEPVYNPAGSSSTEAFTGHICTIGHGRRSLPRRIIQMWIEYTYRVSASHRSMPERLFIVSHISACLSERQGDQPCTLSASHISPSRLLPLI